MAAKLRREFQTDVEKIHGRYGAFQVLVGDEVVIDGGSAVYLGLLPSTAKIIAAVRERLDAGMATSTARSTGGGGSPA